MPPEEATGTDPIGGETGGARTLRLSTPFGQVEGTPEEMARLLALMQVGAPAVASAGSTLLQVHVAASNQERPQVADLPRPQASPLRKLPNNEELVYEYGIDKVGVSKETHRGHVAVVRDFERHIAPKSFIDATVDDVIAYERALLDVCALRKPVYLGGRGKVNVVPKYKCGASVYDLTLTPPEICGRACPKFQMQREGPKARLGSLKHFYEWLLLRGLVTTNVVEPVQRRHAKTRGARESGPLKYAPTTDEVRAILRAAREVLTPRDVGLLLALAKTGRRPDHVCNLMANEIVDLTTPGAVAYLDFSGVKRRFEEHHENPRTKLRGELRSIIDDEFRAFLVETYLPWRQAKWGYAWNEGPLWPGTIKPDQPYDIRNIQRCILDRVMQHLADEARKAGDAAAEAKWRAHADNTSATYISPGTFRHFFTTETEDLGVSREDRLTLRGDKLPEAIESYRHLRPEKLAAKYRMPLLLTA